MEGRVRREPEPPRVSRRGDHTPPSCGVPIEVDPPQREAADERDHERRDGPDGAREIAEVGSGSQDRPTKREDDEQLAALGHVLARDRVIGSARAAQARNGEPSQTAPYSAITAAI